MIPDGAKVSRHPLASIIIRAKNEEALVGEVLTAVYGQTVRDVEVILVDSGSTDRTLEIASQFPLKVIDIRPEEFTFGRALNIGCEAAQGEFLVFVSAHAVPITANWLAYLLSHFGDANVAGVWGGDTKSRTILPQECVVRQDLGMFLSNYQFGFSNANAAIRAGVWRRHAFDEQLPATEDKEWAWRVLNDGYTVVHDSRALVWHYHHETLRQIWHRAHREHVGYANFMDLPLPSCWEVLWKVTKYALRRLQYGENWRERIVSLRFSLANVIAHEIGRYTGLRKGKTPVRSAVARQPKVTAPRAETMDGVSVIICCYNSAGRLPATLTHLKLQDVSPDIPWEVVIVDNASTDGTADAARRSWPNDAPAPLRVVHEPRLGLSYARHRGFSEAKYEIVSFIDDDNWVCPDWIKLVWEIMSRYPNVGACGGCTEAVCEIGPPWWFERYKRYYAIGSQGHAAGDISQAQGYLWGAGMSVRKAAWRQLVNNGFRPLLVDRQGTALSTGGDTELCFALRLAGWALWYDPRLRIRHFLPAGRFEWIYLRRLLRGVGASSVSFDFYRYAFQGNPKTFMERLKRTWHWHILTGSIKLLWFNGKTLLSFHSAPEGNHEALGLETRIGRLVELLRRRKAYQLTVETGRSSLFSQDRSST